MEGFGLLRFFDHWSFSDEVGCFKPFPPIFEHAMAGLGVDDPGAIAHVGDGRRTDVAGALAMGMIAVRATWFADRPPETGTRGDVRGPDHRRGAGDPRDRLARPATPATSRAPIHRGSHAERGAARSSGVVASPAVGMNRIPFERFLEENRVRMMRYLGAAVGPDDADDVFQETFLAALRAWPDAVDDGRLDRWVLKIASRKAVDHHRRTRRAPIPVEAPPDRAVPADEPVGDPIWDAVAVLPVAQREAVLCRFALDLTYADVGELLGISAEAARANVYEGMKKLRERMR